jgi:hypothetical protein
LFKRGYFLKLKEFLIIGIEKWESNKKNNIVLITEQLKNNLLEEKYLINEKNVNESFGI